MSPGTAAASPISQFLGEHSCLIVEPSVAFSSSIQACLSRMGVAPGSVIIARKIEDARAILASKKPKMLITEYQLDHHFGLELIELHEKIFDDDSRISIMMTRDSSDSIIAEAAEEQVDAFLLKPFSPDVFEKKLALVLQKKLNPSPYLRAIKSGKAHLLAKNYPAALEDFRSAKSMHEKPALACFYAGQALQLSGDVKGALVEYGEGRKHQPLHYKCLVSEFEALVALENYPEAFLRIEPLKNNYPLTSKRLTQIFMATIFSRRFDNILEYHDLFLRLEQRTGELVKVASMAMFTAGRHFLEQKDSRKAVNLFEKSVVIANREIAFLDRIVSELIRVGAKVEARDFLSRALPADIGSPAHSRLTLKVDQLTLGKAELLEKGRKLVMAGHGTPEIYLLVVKWMAEEGKKTLAEAVIARATQDHPEMRAELYKLLE